MMRISEVYKLIFNWTGIRYEGNVAYFEKAYFSGPVLQKMVELRENDSIDLDFTTQNIGSGLFIPGHYYIAKLSWKAVEYRGQEIQLTDCRLDHYKTGSLKELRDGMRFFVDCSKHEEHLHYKFLVYPAYVVNELGEELK